MKQNHKKFQTTKGQLNSSRGKGHTVGSHHGDALWRPRHISFRYAVNAPTKPQEASTNREAEYFRQSQASLFWPIRTAATPVKRRSPVILATEVGDPSAAGVEERPVE